MMNRLDEIIRSRLAHLPDRVALGSQHGLSWATTTGRQLAAQVEALARQLAALGVVQGDRVILWLPSHRWTPAYLFAVWRLGAIVVPFDREMNATAATRIIASVTPRLVVTGYDEQPA